MRRSREVVDVIVVKIGGSIAEACPHVLDEAARREDLVLVHGFGPQTDEVCRARGVETRTIRSPDGVTSRFTDDAVLDAMQTAAKSVQSILLDGLAERGADPVGLGVDVPLIWAEAKPALRHQREDGRVVLVRGNRSGRVAYVEALPVEQTLRGGAVPVLAPLALDGRGPVSVDADRAAAALASQLDAEALVLFTDVAGLLEGEGPGAERIDRVPVDAIDDLIGSTATGGMVRKLVAAREALDGGVGRVVIGDGQRKAPIQRALDGDATEVIA